MKKGKKISAKIEREHFFIMFPIIFFSEATNITKGTLCVPRNSYVGDLLLMSCYLLPLKFCQVMRIGKRVVIQRARLLCYKSKEHQYFVILIIADQSFSKAG